MAFCTNCGSEIPASAAYCSGCGRAQPANAQQGGGSYRPPVNVAGPFDGITPRTASIVCYIPFFGVIPAIVILASRRFRRNPLVRFNAFQSVYLFVAWLIASTTIPIVRFGLMGGGGGLLDLVKLAFVICWILLLVKAAQEEQLHLPIVGDLAARSANEQQ